MTNTNSISKFIYNKYIITLASFIVLMLFIDHNDIFVQLQRRKQLNDLMASKQFYEAQIQQTKKNLSDLQSNAAALEKYAREKYFLKKDNEDIFIVPSANTQKNAAEKQ